MTQRVCKRCLLRELDGTYFQSIYEYIQNLPPQWKPGQRHVRAVRVLCGSPRRQDKPALRGDRPAVVSTL